MSAERRPLIAAPRFTPLVGAAVGAVGGGTYWIGAQIWPTSIAVVVAMAATTMLTAATRTGALGGDGPGTGPLATVFAVLIKYNALMALSAVRLPYPLPANIALGLMMIAAHTASCALRVSLASSTQPESNPPSHLDVAIALALGFAPAALLGLTGLIGLAAAILARILYVTYAARRRAGRAGRGARSGRDVSDSVQLLTEVCFYLGAAAALTLT